MDRRDIYRVLAERITDQACVAFIGAGVSASLEDGGRRYPGLPLARDLLNELQASREYLSDVANFSDAAFLVRSYEGRSQLEMFLRSRLGTNKLAPLPAHSLLARIRFAAYVSLNFDTLLEDALRLAGATAVTVVEDSDVSQLVRGVIPVVKPHGTIDRPATLCVATDEVLDFGTRTPIINDLLATLLANRTVLFLGFGMADQDFIGLIRYLRQRLDRHMPKSFAVVKNTNTYLDAFWQEQNVTIIEEDATRFLSELHECVRKRQLENSPAVEPWMRHPFFVGLGTERTVPTETEVVDEFLAGVKECLQETENVSEVRRTVMDAADAVLSYRPNYPALRAVATKLDLLFQAHGDDQSTAWTSFRQLLDSRAQVNREIAAQAPGVLGTAKTIGLYGKSQRVAEFLSAMPPHRQRQITLYIAECRPKSPLPFDDAQQTVALLAGSFRNIRMTPDVGLLHLIGRKMLDIVLLGAHAVYRSTDGMYKYFVNTCGSTAVVKTADEAGVPVGLVFEREKEILLQDDNEPDHISFREEIRIAPSGTQNNVRPNSGGNEPIVENFGYDIVPWCASIIVVTNGDFAGEVQSSL